MVDSEHCPETASREYHPSDVTGVLQDPNECAQGMEVVRVPIEGRQACAEARHTHDIEEGNAVVL